jgi:hypothetical protein
MAKTAIKKLRAVLGSDESPADPDGDMAYDDGNPNGVQPDTGERAAARYAVRCPRPFEATCRAMLAAATSSLAATDDPALLASLAKALAKSRKQVDDTIARIERQRAHDAESAALTAIGF